MPADRSSKNPWLDLLRSLAILLVLFRHGERALASQGSGFAHPLQTLFLNGWIGVDLFFVLSGYLIARHLLRAGIGSGEFHWGRYIAQRALRILPAYYAVLLLTVAGAFTLYQFPPGDLGWRIAYHLLLLQDYLPSDINVVFWSLGVEEKFYLLAPVAVLLLLHCRSASHRVALLLACFALPLVLRSGTFLLAPHELDYAGFWRIFRSPFHMSIEGFVVGVAIALAERSARLRPSRRTGMAWLGGATLVLLGWMATGDFMARIDWVDATLRMPLIAVIAGAMVLGAVQLAATAMPFSRVAEALARLSYGLYLIHFPLIPVVMAMALPHGLAAFWAAYFAVSLLAALLLHMAVERPFLQWKDRLARQARTQASTGEAAAPASLGQT